MRTRFKGAVCRLLFVWLFVRSMASGSGSYASMTRRKSEPKLSMSSDRSTLPQDSAAYMLFLEAQVAKNLTTPQQLHALDERMAALAAAQKAVASRCSELDGKMSGSVRLVKIAQSYAEQVGPRCRRAAPYALSCCFPTAPPPSALRRWKQTQNRPLAAAQLASATRRTQCAKCRETRPSCPSRLLPSALRKPSCRNRWP